ncbi:MAG TPA: glycoside hydrolase family 3 N-terminal domain-containing protein [Blastocatellia bacterium]|nr:glycoside hydrolase family 3 N-terminal domain-containing protein [Blastocatellia bacterium]
MLKAKHSKSMFAARRIVLCFVALSLSNVHEFLPVLATQLKPTSAVEAAWVEKTLASMTLDEKVGQLIIPAVIGMFLSQDGDVFKQIRRDITEFHVGGYHMLGEVNTIHEPAGVALLINHMQELSKLPLMITADFEGGAGLRYIGATRLPRAMAIGATANAEMAFQAGRVCAEEARAIGINVNFYPVVDVNNNSRNPIINIRSFGGDPDLVARMARAYIRGSQSAGVMATAKHFPGHGDTSIDSHLELPSIAVDRSRLNSIELPPFRAAIQEGVGGVMTAHIALPKLETENLPATLSPKILTGVLRGELGFEGVVFTDALDMQGVTAHFPDGEAAVRAIKAGADVLLYPPNVEQAFVAVKRAVQSGEIKESRIDESARRILSAKAKLGLQTRRIVDLNKLDLLLGTSDHQRIAREIIETAVTLVRDKRNALPLKLNDQQRVLVITLLDSSEGWRDGVPGRAFLAGLASRHVRTTDISVSDKTSPAEFALIRKLAALSDVVIVNGFIRVAAYKGSIDLNEGQINLLKHLSALDKPFAFVLYGSPYVIGFVPELPSYVLTYEYHPAAEEAALKAVLGEIEFKGKLPVELPGFYPIGHSVVTAKPASSTR